MKSRQDQRSEETRQAILDAALSLFTTRGYDAVTMRQIAQVAGYSHTAIYLYFKDKEDLLMRLALPRLQGLMDKVLPEFMRADNPQQVLYRACWTVVEFFLHNPNLYPLLFTIRAERVDEPGTSELTAIRNRLFDTIVAFIQRHAPIHPSPINAARTLVFFLNGFVFSYVVSTEPVNSLIERIQPILLDSVTIYWQGILHTS